MPSLTYDFSYVKESESLALKLVIYIISMFQITSLQLIVGNYMVYPFI